jgi:branched-subunit amino acid aminotransferase/4-amino-4-deoxychorismate lyase
MFWDNGKLHFTATLSLEIDHPGWLYGATVFTTLRVYDRTLEHPLTQWKEHCDRLRDSVAHLGWQQPNWDNLRSGAEAMLVEYPVLRITLFHEGREVITGRSLPADLTQRQQNGIRAWLADDPQFQRTLPLHKTGNYLSAWLALQGAQQRDAREAILVDREGNWLETSTGNLWGWQNGIWWTSPLETGILPGLMRSRLMARLQEGNRPVIQQLWNTDVARGFEAMAYTNSVVEIVPIHTVLLPASQSHDSLSFDPYHPSLQQLHDCLHSEGMGGLS